MKKRLGIGYDYLFHALPGHYLVVANNTPHYTIVEVSDSLCEMLHVKRNDLLEHTFREVFFTSGEKENKEGVKAALKSLKMCIKSRKPHSIGAVRYDVRDKTGQLVRRLWETTNYPIMHDGKVAGVLASIEDVTERYEEATHNEERLQQLERLVELNASKDEFISIASHQLRTPATGVKQYLAMLKDGMFGELEPTQRDVLLRAYESNERQLRIVTDMLKVAQVDADKVVLHKQSTNISQLVHEVIGDYGSVLKDRMQSLAFHPLDGKALAYVDGDVIRMVIENLLDNASKYSEEDTTIEVSVHRNARTIGIEVKDEGVGVPMDARVRLFDKFVRIENPLSIKVGGTGLGLYWAKKIVDLHEGKITYRANHPKGSIFTILLPKE